MSNHGLWIPDLYPLRADQPGDAAGRRLRRLLSACATREKPVAGYR
ncbi:hypothetical protein ACPA9J_16565 [Pseudomonas aeruginosa]